MKERPILFSGPMVRAILDGRKTQTRRSLTAHNSTLDGSAPCHKPDTWSCWENLRFSGVQFEKRFQPAYVDGIEGNYQYLHVPILHTDGDESVHRVRCRWEPGDRLWVRENGWKPKTPNLRELRDGADTWPKYAYDADGLNENDTDDFRQWGWKRVPSIHMPRWASRITLEITKVRVERLQEIAEADALAEGVLEHDHSQGVITSAKCEYIVLWDRINGKKHPWASNPWVWVLEFKRV